MRYAPPHWLSQVAALTGAVCGALAAQHTFPAFDGVLAAVAGVCAIVAAPNYSSKEGA